MAAPVSDQAVETTGSRRLRFCFGKSARIAKREVFDRVMASGRKFAGRFAVVWIGQRAAEASGSRLGVLATKRTFHDSVDRNRARRLIRESFRRLRLDFGFETDVVVVARARILSAGMDDVLEDMRKAFAALGLVERVARESEK